MGCSRGVKGQLNRLQRSTRGSGRLEPANQKPPIPAGSGIGFVAGELDSSAAGIASPLTEAEDSREYFTAQTLTSSDGMFVLEWEPVKKLRFTDANSNQAVFDLLEPAP